MIKRIRALRAQRRARAALQVIALDTIIKLLVAQTQLQVAQSNLQTAMAWRSRYAAEVLEHWVRCNLPADDAYELPTYEEWAAAQVATQAAEA